MQLIDGQPVYAATDLVGFLACRHRFGLERAALADLVRRPERNDPEIELIRKRGFEHEARYRAELEAARRHVLEIEPDASETDAGARLRAAAAATEAAMRDGADVIYQATFFDGRWRGHADFLLRVDEPSALGAWSYEVADTKLARRVKGSAVLQICSYVDLLTPIQGIEPAMLHVVLGGSTRTIERLRVADYMAYYRQVKAAFEAEAGGEVAVYPVTATYPDPVEHCDVCRWAAHCAAQRRRDDDLSLVAGISSRQRVALKARGIATRHGLAGLELPLAPRLEGVSGEALARVRDQARIQVEGEAAGAALYELLDPERDREGRLVPDRGLLALPEPSDHDLFFDIEGDPFALDDGVEYLFGVLEPGLADPSDPVRPRFHALWSRDGDGQVTRAAEREAFEALVDLLMGRWRTDRSLHVYHYAAYERSALTRLAQRHATREAEVDELLRNGVLVDLYRVVRQGIRASVESYSIKKLEPMYGLHRDIALQSAGSSIVAFETWLEGGATEGGIVGAAILAEIETYNRDDVVSNWKLRNWLEARRWDLEAKIDERPGRPDPGVAGAEPNPATERDQAAAELAAALTGGALDAPRSDSNEDAARWLLAQLLGWHRREDKAFFWRYYELLDCSDEERVEAREPLGAVTFLEELGATGRDGRLQRFSFPRQEHDLRVGGSVVDPETRRATGTVVAIDEAGQTVTLRRSRNELERNPAPTSLVPYDFIGTDVLQDALLALGRSVITGGLDRAGPGRAGLRLLRGTPPDVGQQPGIPLRMPLEPTLDAATRLALALDRDVLAIQGPPGSGKTYTAARVIVELVKAGRTVGVTANSHKVIGHLLDEIAIAAVGVPEVRLGQKPGQDGDVTCEAAIPFKDGGAAREALRTGLVTVLGGTAWVWSNEQFRESVDVLVVDEAGQLSLATTLAASLGASSLILLGDPQQLDQPLRAAHPAGAERSALGHLLADRSTLPPHSGLFLDRTWRLHPDLCAYTSEAFYARELQPEPGLEIQDLDGLPPADGTGVRWWPIEHAGNTTASAEEAEAVTSLVERLLDSGASWTDAFGVVRPIDEGSILIVAPYNDQVELIARRLEEQGRSAIRVGTVDRFQGQEAVIAIYSMTTSRPEDAPRGMEFLFSRNRLNVATSRARCVAIVVGSPALVRAICHTPRQMRLANALCQLLEAAVRRAPAASPSRTST
ncbi:MAG TPA: TM0106 family RecB-like putative nuclease [Candidatus Limnocylindrales bacterium]|nr:TM0106 family RecB-like putative nuclease [Candidatus Limnocylindrales bacterium]